MEPFWRNTPVLIGVIVALLVIAGVVQMLINDGFFEKDVTVNYDYYHNDTNGRTIVEIRLWNETDETKVIDGEGFRLDGKRLTGWNTIYLEPYGYRSIKVSCGGFHDGTLSYDHGGDVSMHFVRNDRIIPDD